MVRTEERPIPSDPGIAPVPEGDRALGAWDMAVLWGDLGIGLLVLVTGALLVPGLGLGTAFVAIVLGSIVGVWLLGLVASAGASHGVPTMVLFRPVLGLRGSWVASALNVVQLVGWVAVEFWAMSFVADLVSERVFGFSARGLWLGVVAVVCTGLALWGPVGVTKKWLERFGAWVTAGICGVLTVLVLTSDIQFGVSFPGDSAFTFPTFGQALDLVIAMPISWLPLVADYSRFARGPRPAFRGAFWGYLVANVWLYTLGALIVLSAPVPVVVSPEGIAVGILALAGGSIAGVLFLMGLLAGETDEAFANLYSTAVSLRNILPKLSQKVVIVGIALIGAALASVLNMVAYESFLFFIGSVFVPLFGIFIADHFVLRRARLDVEALYEDRGRYGGVRLSALIPWLLGFFVFHWINPSPLTWWVELFTGWFGEPISTKVSWLPGSLPAFVASFAATIIARRVSPNEDREVTP